ncbi:MAG: NAD-dependent epimerase/dehydratase family protein [Gammaproteobacteria bacterium]
MISAESTSGLNCVILGGGGFIGSAIADRLLADGHSLRIFEWPRVLPYREFPVAEKVEWVKGDMLSRHDLTRALEGMDVVLHLVSTTLPKNSNDDPIYDVQSNLVGSLQMLNLMAELEIRRIVFISSGGTVYGSPEYLPIDERHPTNPRVSYGITKLAIEKYLLMYERLYGIQATILRVANPYGERQRVETAQGAVGVFLNRALRSLPVDIWGDGSVVRDYLHVSDVAEAFARAVTYRGDKHIFNISSGTGVSLNQLLDILEDVLELSIRRNYLPARPFDVPVSILSPALAKQELAWEPRVSLPEGILRTARWLNSQSFA